MQVDFATEDDALDVFEWRNDPQSRKMFFDENSVSLEEHMGWFSRVLADETKELLIGRIDGEKVGVCRFDIDDSKSSAEVSINLNPAMRGKALSKAFLAAAMESFAERHAATITAKVKKINAPSNKIFRALGFVLVSEDELVNHYEYG